MHERHRQTTDMIAVPLAEHNVVTFGYKRWTTSKIRWHKNIYYSAKAGGVTWSFILSVSRITHDRGNGHQPNMVGMGEGGNPLEVIDFSCWSGSGHGCRISLSLFLILADTNFSPGGDAAAALSSSSFILNQAARPIKTTDRGQTGIHRICSIYTINTVKTHLHLKL